MANKIPKELVDLQKSLVKLRKEERLELEKIQNELEQIKAEQQAILESSQALQDLEDQQATSVRFRITESEKLASTTQEQVDLHRRAYDLLNQELRATKEALKLEEIRKEKGEELTEERKKEVEELEKQALILQQLLDEQRKNWQEAQKTANIYAEAADNVEGVASWLGIAATANETWTRKAFDTLKSATSIGDTIRGYAASIGTSFNAWTLTDSAIKKVVESTLGWGRELDNTLAAFNKATGAGGEYNTVINEVRLGSSQFGIGLQEASEATQALFENMTSFTQLSVQAQTSVAETTARMTKLGISAEVTAQNLDISMRALNMTAQQAIATQEEIAAVAIELGVAPNKLATDFANAAPKLAAYGKESIEVFKDLAAQSKATGIDMQGLLAITAQFDTFEGAAQAAGSLNAILGGNLVNSVDLLNASEGERIMLLREGVKASGQSWDAMNRFQRMAVANAAGINDINEANRIFGQSDAEFEKVRAAQEATAISTQALRDAAQQATSAQEKFTLITQAFSGAALPLLEVLHSILNPILELNDALGGVLVPAFVGGALVIGLLVKAVSAAIATKQAFASVVDFTAAKFGQEKEQVDGLTEAIQKEMKAEQDKNQVRDQELDSIKGVTDAIVDNKDAIEETTGAIEDSSAATSIASDGAKEFAEAIAKGEDPIAAAKSAVSAMAGELLVEAKARTVSKFTSIAETKAQIANTAARIKGSIATAASITWEYMKHFALGVTAIAMGSATMAEGAYTAAKQKGVLATIAFVTWEGLKRIAALAVFPALFAATMATQLYSLATGSATVTTIAATGATTAFGIAVAIATSPITLIVLGIMALIGAIVALVVYFDDISAVISDVTGGFFDLWDLLLFGIPVIGPVILMGKKLYENWSAVVDIFTNVKNTIVDAFMSIITWFDATDDKTQSLLGPFYTLAKAIFAVINPFETIIGTVKEFFAAMFAGDVAGMLKAPLNAGVNTINKIIGGMNVIPGVNIPNIPKLAKGATNFGGGLAMVGEKGPELVSLPPKSNVITNENAEALAGAGAAKDKATAMRSAEVAAALDRLANAIENGGSAEGDGTPVILKLDEREIGKFVFKALDKRLKLNTVGN